MEREPAEADDEFRIAIVGPLTSLALGVLFVLIGYIGRIPPLTAFFNPQSYETTVGPFLPVFQWLGPINILMGLFNLLPGFPLDGGRVLRSILWKNTGDLRIATRYTYLAGQVFAGALLAVGAAMVLGIKLPILGANLMNGMWIAFIGWFLLTSSSSAEPEEKAQESLEGIPVERLMRHNIPSAVPAMPLSVFVNDRLMKTDDIAYPVVYQDKLVGLITLDHVRDTPREKWDSVRVAEVMTTRDKLSVLSPRADSMDALHFMVRKAYQVLPVVDGKNLAGMLYYSDLQEWMKARAEGPLPGGSMSPDTNRD
jgi:CBS domain-containing protein